MANLRLFDLYKNNCENTQKDDFLQKVNSKVELKIDSNKAKSNNDWIKIIEETLPYIANAIDKPNRLLNNNEEILQIEKTRKVTVDSIKHLSKNTNLIQEIDEKENVVPKKILNVLKEESYATYENRFIYTLVLRINDFIANKKQKAIEIQNQNYKEAKDLKYTASTAVGKESVDISINIKSNVDAKTGETNASKSEDVLGKIEQLEKTMLELTTTQNFKLFEKARFLLVTPPLKMTNALLKNPNLQCAVKLWNYIMDAVEKEGEREQNSQKIVNNSKLKKYIDESFLLNYVILNNYDGKLSAKQEDKYIEILVEDLIDKALGLNSSISKEKLNNIINKKYKIIKNKIVLRNLEIEDTYKKAFEKYIKKIEKIKI